MDPNGLGGSQRPRVPARPGRAVGWAVMTPDERWLAALWPSVRASLPAPPVRVLEIGCGPLGGFVPMLQASGYEATGIDPEAPAGAAFRQVGFEDYVPSRPAGAIIACTSLHHVTDLNRVLDLAAAALVPNGVMIVVEWAREHFDEATAGWRFARLPGPGADRGWLNDRYEQWQASGQRWDAYFRAMLKADYGMAHGAAHRVSLLSRQAASGASAPASGPATASPGEVADALYAGKKAPLRSLHDQLMAMVHAMGPDVSLAPKKGYVSPRRPGKQFAMIQPSGAGRIDLGLILPGVPPGLRWSLPAVSTPCSPTGSG